MNNSRRSQIKKITQKLYDSIYECFAVYGEELQGILDEEQEAYDNLPESIQESDRGQQMSACIDNLETVIGSCEDVDENYIFDEITEMLEVCEVEL